MTDFVHGQVKFRVKKLNADSLAALIPEKEGTEKIDAMNLLSNVFCRKDFDSSINLANRAIELSEKLDYQKGLADGYFNVGNIYFLLDSLEPTISNYLKAYRIYEDLEPSQEFANLCIHLGSLHYYSGTATLSPNQFKRLVYLLDDKYGKYIYNYTHAFTLSDYDSSIYYFQHALSFIDTAVARNELAYTYCMIGQRNRFMYRHTHDTAYWSKAFQWYFKALGLPGLSYDAKSLSYIFIIQVYLSKNTEKNIRNAFKYLQMAEKMAVEWTGKYNFRYQIYRLYGKAHFRLGNYWKAIDYYKRSLVEIAERLTDFSVNDYREPMLAYEDKYILKINKKICYNAMFDCYSSLGDYKTAHEYYVMAKQADEEIYLEKNQKLITMMEVTSKDEKNQSRIDLLARDNKLKALAIKQSRTLNFGIAAIFVVLLLVGLLLWRQNKLKNESRNKILEQKYLHDLELKHLEAEKLKELDHLKSRFFANISHEFRTPLTLIMGPVDKVLSQTENNNHIKELSVAKKYAAKLQTLINNLLTISKLESGKMKLFASETDVVMLVRSYLQSFESLAGQKKITLKFISVDKEIKAYIDQEKFEQVLNNLLSNAFKFTDERGKIEIAISKADIKPTANSQEPTATSSKWAEIKISDTGRGIPSEHINHIFDRFYQVGQEDNSYYEGTGIGLALTKELVELHRGTIKVESEPGKGSTFFLILPLGKDHLIPEEIEVKKPQAILQQEYVPTLGENQEEMVFDEEIVTETNHEQPILLIVEDNADMRAYIREHFENDYQIIEAVDGMDGLEKSTEHIPDIIISDVMMPRMDGNEFCLKVKSDERTSHIPVILLTARASSEDKIEGIETGADDFISKPFDGKELKVRVKNLIEQRKKTRAHLERKIQKSNITHHIDFKDSGITSMDEQFLQKVIETVRQHHNDPQFNTIKLGQDVGLGKIQLNRKIKALTGETTVSFIRTYRLNRASELIKNKSATVAEIAYDVGFSSPSYFTECFRQHFGQLPSEFSGN